MKKVYKQLNRLNIGFEIEPMEFSDIEKERIKRNILKGKKKNLYTRNLVAAATFMVASTITIGVGFPAFAASIPLIGNVFELFNDDNDSMFEKYNDHSSTIGITRESNGVEVTVTDAVYDGENITIAYILKSEKDLGERPALSINLIAEELKNTIKNGFYSTHYLVEKLNDNEYAVIYIYELLRNPRPEELLITLEAGEIVDLNNANNSTSGDWNFKFKITALESEKRELAKDNLKTEANGIEINAIQMTETPISTTIYLSEKVDVRLVAKEEEKWGNVGFDYQVTDNLGNSYDLVQYNGVGHSTDFERMRSEPRITIKNIDKQATALIINPTVNVYKMITREGQLASTFAPYSIEPITIPIK